MTQSGQGDDQQLPAVRPVHEGVVLPAEGGASWSAGGPAGGQPDQAAPAGGQPWGSPWGPGSQDGRGPGQLPPEQPQQGGYAPQQPHYQQYAPQQDPYQQYGQPLPPEAAHGGARGGDADATQFIAPVPGGPGPGGLPPENPAESTQYLPPSAPPGRPGDADATQYIPPVPGDAPYAAGPGTPGDRQPPAEFDSLFRDDAPAPGTQQMPRYDQGRQQRPQPPHQAYQGGPAQPPQGGAPFQPGPQGHHGGHGPEDGGREAPRGRSAAVPLIAAVVIGCAVIGLGAGALMSGGDDSKDDKQSVASQSSDGSGPSSSDDPAKPQAEALDKLLADSNNSRAAVIGAVEKTKNCRALDEAAADLSGAAGQRRELVTRLEALSVDKLPASAGLKAALTKAWQASAEADDRYAAWAGQAKNDKKVCKGGKARGTDEKNKADAASFEATTAKREASKLWNSIAQKYGLTKRASTQL